MGAARIIKQSRIGGGGEIKLSAMTGRGEILFGEERRREEMRAKPSWPPWFCASFVLLS
jgi:hypothetical protein